METLFHAARARPEGPQRQAYLDGACGSDLELRSRVEALLAADEEASGFLGGQAIGGEPESLCEGPGSSIGPYKLLQQIGEGGMGVVYMAEQEQPVVRKVALKVIKLGMDTKQVIARFEAERQALAMMDHPHIARVLEAGATDSGRPYFVMELVRGIAITDYCDKHKLTTEERLRLFADVCRAVQHAHQKGVIHRDLKPTNVLVTSHDGMPVPKIIDFGVAKATNQRLTERTLFTEFQQVIGTPEYMSPEQAEMSGLDVDTRSDVYALGVLLYQLLTGTTPVDPATLRTAAFEEMTRIIREEDAPAPSTRISKLGPIAETVAERRGSDPHALSRHFRGELDWIVLKALEKDRTRRYQSASVFADDVLRHLGNRPVEAGPVSTAYRLRKFAHRHRRAVAAALAVLVALGLGLAGTTAGFLRARAEAERSLTISDSLQDVLAMTDAARASDRAEIEAVLETVREVFGPGHATYAAVLDTLATRLHDAGDFETATELRRASLDVWKGVYGGRHPNVAIALARLGSLLRLQGEDEEAESALRASLELLGGASDAPGLAGYEARVELADLLANRGEYVEADELLAESLAILRASPSPSRFRIIETLEQRLQHQLNQESAEAGETLRAIYEETHAFYPEDSPLLAIWALTYGKYLLQHGQREAAEPYLREAVARFRASPDPPAIYSFAAYEALFQLVRSRPDPDSVAEADALLRGLIANDAFLGIDVQTEHKKFYAHRMLERRRYAEALDAVMDAHQLQVEAGRSIDERESVRDSLAMIAFRTSVAPDLAPPVYARARAAAELALTEEPDHPAMAVASAAALYRQGELALAAETLERSPLPLSQASGNLARRMAPGDHGFRAMVYARLGEGARALSELELLRAALREDDGEPSQRFAEEVEAVIERARASGWTTSSSG